MLRRYKGTNNGEEEVAHFVLLKWGAAVLRPYRAKPKTGTGVPCPYWQESHLVFASEAVVHSYADVAAEGGEADGVLVLLV